MDRRRLYAHQYAETTTSLVHRNNISPPDRPGAGYVSLEGAASRGNARVRGADRVSTSWTVADCETIEYDPTRTVSYSDIRRFGGEDRGNVND
jgi:hypothetical protein